MLFVDYSSAFNTIIPDILINKLDTLGLPSLTFTCKDFLTNSLYTYDCRPAHRNNIIVKFADDTTVVGLISEGDEATYREDVQKLSTWCSENNLTLNTSKTKEIILDFRRTR